MQFNLCFVCYEKYICLLKDIFFQAPLFNERRLSFSPGGSLSPHLYFKVDDANVNSSSVTGLYRNTKDKIFTNKNIYIFFHFSWQPCCNK